MTRIVLPAAVIAAIGLGSAPAWAQQDVVRHSYTFFDRHITIDVAGPASGSLQVVRGESGRIDVAARSPEGVPGFALGGQRRDQLRLSAVGATATDFMVVVPENVVVNVRLPGQAEVAPAEPHLPTATWRWEAVSPAGTGDAPAPAPAPAAAPTGYFSTTAVPPLAAPFGQHLAYAAHAAPALVDLPSLDAVRSITVIVTGDHFRLHSSRPLMLRPGAASHLELRLAGEPVDVTLHVPAGARFRVTAGDATLLAVQNRMAETPCIPAAVLDGGQRIVLTPMRGQIDCR
jgi:hypothetical protein